ncbi:ATP-binding cassette domain-containing protein [Paenibacillus sp. FSL L8-0638]|uniref:ATP-binding cassette domain-containing protein n=1 Tax=Paenibacillus sp. FSL L8-0638 TaxID=2921604 RepID=UPI00315891DE
MTGRTGSGKSTLLYCLTGLMHYEGEIWIGGRNIRTLTPQELSRTSVTITQRPILYQGTRKADLYQLIADELPGTLVIGISHKATHGDFYQYVLNMETLQVSRLEGVTY